MSIITHDIQNITEDTLPPVTCAPWCQQGDGHPDEFHVEDQTCWGTDARTVTADGEIIATLRRQVGGVTHVYVCIETMDPRSPMAQMELSPEFFREWLAMAQKNVCAVLDEAGGCEQ